MKKGKLPTVKILEDQNRRVLWFGDENATDVNFNASSVKNGDQTFWVQNGVRKKMGFWVRRASEPPVYYKEADRHLVIKPRWWRSQIKAKPGERAICIGGDRRREEVNPVKNPERETLFLLEEGFGIMAREIIDGTGKLSEEVLLRTVRTFEILLKLPVPHDSPVRISVLVYLNYLENGEGIPDSTLPKVNTFLLEGLQKGTQLIQEETVRFLAENDGYFAFPRNSEVDARAILAAVKEVIGSMPPEVAFDYLEVFGIRP